MKTNRKFKVGDVVMIVNTSKMAPGFLGAIFIIERKYPTEQSYEWYLIDGHYCGGVSGSISVYEHEIELLESAK